MKIKGKEVTPESELTDTPSRLYRKIFKQLGMTIEGWATYMDDWAKKTFPDKQDDMLSVKTSRSTMIGNLTKEIWHSNSLTFNKFIQALAILKIKRIRISIQVTTDDDKQYSSSEEFIVPKPRIREKD